MAELVTQEIEDILVVSFTQNKLITDTVIIQVGRELLDCAKRANGKLLLDFQGVTFMSSAMIGKIVLMKKTCDANKVEIKLCNISPSIKEVFEITRLNKIFDIRKDQEAAIKAFNKKGFFGRG